MKNILLIALLLSSSVNASELPLEIEKKAAALSSCTIKKPCEITIEKSSEQYVAKVKRSTIITDYGVLKYRTGSIDYHIFDNKGTHIESKATT